MSETPWRDYVAMKEEEAAKQARAELRDRFAMAALTGVLANPSHDMLSPEEWATDAYNIADAMLKARDGGAS